MIHHSGAFRLYSLPEGARSILEGKVYAGDALSGRGDASIIVSPWTTATDVTSSTVRQPGFEAPKLPASVLVASVRRKTQPMSVAPKIPPVEAGDGGVVGRHRVASPQCPVSQAGGRERFGRRLAVLADAAAKLRHRGGILSQCQMPEQCHAIAR